jgi:hypothetical protein
MFGSYGVVWSTYTTSRQTRLSTVDEQMLFPSADKLSHGVSKMDVLLKVQDLNTLGCKQVHFFALIVRDRKCLFQEKMHNFGG